MSKTFLLEIGTEPMPARFIAPALAQLKTKAEALLRENRLAFSSAATLGTLRRLSLIVEGVSDKSPALAKEVQGPPAKLLKGPDGAFTPQAEGFARKNGVSPEDLSVAATPKGDMLVARLTIPGETAPKILARILPVLIASLDFPKTLEWEETRFRFGRPIRTLTALLGKTVVAFELAGIKSGRALAGLAAEGKKPGALADASRYVAALRNLSVLADVAERREALLKKLEKTAGGAWDRDQDLVEETVFMTEHPSPVEGRFKEEYLALPSALLAMVMKKQLKFFPVYAGKTLKAQFIGVRDGISEGQAQVREGYEKVLAARLSDAAFFLSRDVKTRLEEKLPQLERVTYQRSLGSMAAKANRVASLSSWLREAIALAGTVDVDAASLKEIARLAYADLVTEVVKEFPELQGAMGGFYARRDGCPETVSKGIEQFYFPVGGGTPVPEGLEAALASLAGKIDSLAGHFAVGNVPSGSADPFALRRQATGLARILIERKLPVNLEDAFAKALAAQEFTGYDAGKVLDLLREFSWARAQTLFEELGYKVDEIRSVRSGGLKNLPRTLARLAAIHGVRQDPAFEPLAAAFKRAANILKQAKLPSDNGHPVDRAGLKEPAELSLFDALQGIEGSVLEKTGRGAFDEGLRTLVAIKPHVDAFFDKVMVMASDPEFRRRRLGLLAQLVRLFNSVADLSQIQSAQ